MDEPTISVWNYLDDYQSTRNETLTIVDEVLSSGQLILGAKVETFEHDFAAYCGCRHGVGVANGTDAIFLALKALGIGTGDEVITTAFTAIPTVSAIVSTGATPVFVDVKRDTLLINAKLIEQAITSRTRCLLPVHLYGAMADMRTINDIAKRHNLYVVEDCAQAHGAELDGQRAGSMSDIAAFSFYPTKILGAYGDGGMVVTSNDELARHVRRLRFYGQDKTIPQVVHTRYAALEHGYNSRLDELQAALLLAKLPHIGHYIERRRHVAAMYDEQLSDASVGITHPTTIEGCRHAYHLYVARHPRRNDIISRMQEHGIQLGIHYPTPVHLMPAYKYLGYTQGMLPETERAAMEVFSLPMYPTLSDSDVCRVCKALKSVVKSL